MQVTIIGNGISGITAARWVRKMSNHDITVISSETEHFYSRTALMYIYMGHMKYEHTKPYEDWFWEKNRINLVYDHVESVDTTNKTLRLKKSGADHQFDKLIIASGSKSNKFGWPGQDADGVGGLYHIQDVERMEAYSNGLKRAVIVGGGLIGIEMAEMFASRDIPVTMIVREKSYWDNVLPEEESQLITDHIRAHHLDLRLESNLQEILTDEAGRATGIIVKETGEKIDCGFVGLTPGVSPNVAFLKDSGIDIGRGIKVNRHLETNVPDIYAIGDCAEQLDPPPGRRPIEAVWYTGRMMGETVAYNVCGKQINYDPGIWFNSAKFLDIEYQVYGNVQRNLLDHQDTIFWAHPDGTKCVRILYDKETKAVDGFNLLGIRYRHEVCEKWLKEKAPMSQVLQQLSLANFDPELCEEHEAEVIAQYNQKEGESIQLKTSRNLNKVFSFLKN